jgi:hypothetical protein
MPVVHEKEFLVCCFSTTFVLFAVGVSSLGVAIWCLVKQGGVNCGENGKPPLLNWVLGTGISYLIIAVAYARIEKGKARGCSFYIANVSQTFIFAWMIVGAVSLWRDGTDCETINNKLWKMGLSAVIISIVVWVFGVFVSTSVYTDEETGGR